MNPRGLRSGPLRRNLGSSRLGDMWEPEFMQNLAVLGSKSFHGLRR